MELINLKTGKIYTNGYPYIQWFEGQYSIGMVYNMPICFLSNKQMVNINLSSSIFSLLDINKLITEGRPIMNHTIFYEYLNLDDIGVYNINGNINNDININDFQYIDLNNLKTDSVESIGVKYNDNIYIHIIYVSAYSDVAAEYIDDINIDGEVLKIGIDLYDDNESLYINMSNMGINIPNAIQKSIYPSNVHNDKDDKILLNRKWKELLSNYWDIMANKGSYKSLLNSLKWFEYGDLLQLKELWKYSDIDNKVKYREQELKTFITDIYSAEMSRFAKTTYYSISLALQELVGETEEFNPVPIQKNIPLWSKEDLSLKLSLLGSFFETYFLPIHLDIIKCTIEDIVFTSNIKLLASDSYTKNQVYFSNEFIKCNINNGDVFILTNVSSQVNSDTRFNTGIQQYYLKWIPLNNNSLLYNYTTLNDKGLYSDGYLNWIPLNNNSLLYNYTTLNDKGLYSDEYYENNILGVDDTINTIKNDEDLKLFMSQLFNGVGTIIDVSFEIPLDSGDFIQKENLYIKTSLEDKWSNNESYVICKEQDNKAIFNFKLLCREEADYELKVDFTTGTGKILNKSLNFKVIDDVEINIGIFKIKNMQPSLNNWYGGLSNDYNIRRLPRYDKLANTIIQYIPIDNNKKTGVRLNNVLIFLSTKYLDRNDYFDENHEFLRDNYFITHNDNKIYDDDGVLIGREQYTICVSKQFDFDPTEWLDTAVDSPKKYIYKNTYEYFPEFHYLEELTGNTLSDYTAYDNDALCVVPFIGGDRDNILKYGQDIKDAEWEFENITTGEIIKLNNSIREPYITNKKYNKYLDYGYYNITFRYRLGNIDKEIKLNSAFRKIKGIKTK